jgi:putative flippase GtrA
VGDPGTLQSKAAELWKAHGEKVRYLVVGMFNTAVGYVVFLIALATVGRWAGGLASSPVQALSVVGRKSYLVAQLASWAVMVPISTSMFKFFVFRTPGKWLHQVARAYLVYLPAQGISMVLLWLSVQILHLRPEIGQLLTIAFATVFSYIGHKYFTFRVPLDTAEVVAEDMLD